MSIYDNLFPSRYEIKKELGKGGFATVYLAKDKHLDRLVALKVLHQTDEQTQETLRNEAKKLANLKCEQIVGVIDIDKTTNGQPYLIMEYVEGGNLVQYLEKQKEKRMDFNNALPILHDIMQGLQRAHEKGVLHRDIKPSNILLTTNGRAKIGDFGLATNLHTNSAHALAGSNGYLAPEVSVTRKQQSIKSDIYALGQVAYEMLAGHTRRHDDPPLSEANPTVPSEIQNVIDTALKSNPDQRYTSVSDFYKEIVKIVKTREEENARAKDKGYSFSIGDFFTIIGALVGVVAFGLKWWRPDLISDSGADFFAQIGQVIGILVTGFGLKVGSNSTMSKMVTVCLAILLALISVVIISFVSPKPQSTNGESTPIVASIAPTPTQSIGITTTATPSPTNQPIGIQTIFIEVATPDESPITPTITIATETIAPLEMPQSTPTETSTTAPSATATETVTPQPVPPTDTPAIRPATRTPFPVSTPSPTIVVPSFTTYSQINGLSAGSPVNNSVKLSWSATTPELATGDYYLVVVLHKSGPNHTDGQDWQVTDKLEVTTKPWIYKDNPDYGFRWYVAICHQGSSGSYNNESHPCKKISAQSQEQKYPPPPIPVENNSQPEVTPGYTPDLAP